MKEENSKGHWEKLAGIVGNGLARVANRFSLVVGVGIFSTSIWLWHTLETRENTQIQFKTVIEASAVKNEITEQMQQRIFALLRMARRWENGGATNPKSWQADARLYLDHVGGYQAIAYTDAGLKIRWILPAPQAKHTVKDLKIWWGNQHPLSGHITNSPDHITITHFFNFPSKKPGFLVWVPVFLSQAKRQNAVGLLPKLGSEKPKLQTATNAVNFPTPDGFIVGFFTSEELFNSILDQTIAPQYAISLLDGERSVYQRLVYSQNRPVQFVYKGTIQVDQVQWGLEIWPTTAAVKAQQTRLPEVVLTAGLAMAGVSAVAVYLAQTAGRRARAIEAANQRLEREIAERQQAEIALRESESILRNFYNSATMMMGVVAQVGDEISDISHNAAAGKFFATVMPMETKDVSGVVKAPVQHLRQWLPYCQKSEQTNSPVQFEYTCDTPLGLRWLSATVCLLPKTADNRCLFSYIVEDITECHSSQAAISKSQKHYQTLVNWIDGIVWEADTDNGVFTFVSQKAERLFGYPLGDWTTNPRFWQDHIHPDDREWVVNYAVEQSQKQSEYELEYRMIAADGRVVWLRDIVSVVSHPEQAAKLRGVMIDITEHKLSEYALKESEEKYRLLFSNELDAVILFEGETQHFLDVNDAFIDLYGYSKEEALSLNLADLKALVENSGTSVEETCLNTQPLVQRQWHCKKDGNVFPVEVSAGNFLWRGRQVMCYVIRDITYRLQMEAELKLSQSRLSLIYNSVSDLIFLIKVEANCHYEFLLVNQAYQQVTGLKEKELIGKTVEQVLSAATAEFVRQKYQEAVEFGEAVQYEEFLDLPKGNLILETTLTPIFNDGGICTHLLGASHDITERKLTEEKLRQSEERWQLALRGNNDGIWDWNIKNNQVFFSSRWKEMLGYQDEEISNHLQEWSRRVHPEDLPKVMELIEEHLGKKTPFYISEHRVLCKDGFYKWILDRGQALWDEQGNPVRMVGSHTDITERKQAEQKLKEAKEYLELVIRASSDGFWDWNLLTNEIYFSARWKEMLGYTDEELPGDLSSWNKVIFAEDRMAALALMEDYNAGRSSRFVATQRFHHKNGSTVYILSRATHIKNAEGRVVRMIGTHTDITELIAVQEALHQSEDRMRALLNAMPDLMLRLAVDGQFLDLKGKDSDKVLSADNLRGSYLQDLAILEPGKNHLLELLKIAVITGDLQTYEHELIKADGVYSYEWRIVKSGVSEAVCIVRDITERQQGEQALKLSEERYRRLVELSPDGIFVAQKGIFKFVNSAVVKMLGCDDIADLLGKSIFDFIHPSCHDSVKFNLRQIEQNKTDTPLQAQKYLRLDGSEIDVEVAATCIDVNGELAVQVVLRDITQRQRAEEALRESQRFIQRIADSTPNILYIYDLIQECNVYVNREIFLSLGYTPEEIKRMGSGVLATIIYPQDFAKFSQYFQQFQLASEGDIYEIEYRMKHKNGSWRWFHSRDTIFSKNAAGKPQQILGTAQDITERKRVEEELQKANQNLTNWVGELQERNDEITVLSSMVDLLQACLTVDEAYKVISQMMPMLFPHNLGGIFKISQSRNLLEAVAVWGETLTTQKIFAPHDCLALRRGQPHLAEDTHKTLLCKHILEPAPTASFCIPMVAQGEATGILYFSYEKSGQLTHAKQQLAITVSRQIALALANLKLHETLQNQSIRDPLTGLFNRRYLEESLERELKRSSRNHLPISVIMLDVDHFKRFNDTFGHEAGDSVLRELGMFLQSHIRGGDIACRYGGEEFTLILPEACLELTVDRAEEIREGIKRLQVQHRRQFLDAITLSLGVACFPQHGPTGEALIRAADAALYRAKKEGRDRVVIAP